MNWKLVRADNGEPAIRERGIGIAPRRRSLLEELAQDPRRGMRQIGPGRWLVSKLSA